MNPAALAGFSLRPGPWLAALKGGATGKIDVNGQPHDAAALRAALMERETGESLAYLTDFLLDDAQQARLAPILRGVQTLYAEAQYAPKTTRSPRGTSTPPSRRSPPSPTRRACPR